MAKARKLPSGRWNVQVYDKETGKRRSFTADTARKAHLLAVEWMENKRESKRRGPTVGEAIDKYINGRDGVLSPSTIQGYRNMRRLYVSDIFAVIPVKNITQEIVQTEIRKLSMTKSAKTVHNVYGLITGALCEVNPDMKFNIALPKIQKRFIELPPVEEVIRAVKGTDIELPAMLAMWLSLSVSEIRGIKVENINNWILTIKETVVQVDGKAVHKESTKAYDRTRRLAVPPYIMSLIQKTDAYQNGSGYIETRSVTAIGCRFRRVLEKAGVEHMTFHQLRHMNASIMAALGIPNLYAQERGGWSTDHTLKTVYQHTFSKEREAVDKTIDKFFNEKIEAAE